MRLSNLLSATAHLAIDLTRSRPDAVHRFVGNVQNDLLPASPYQSMSGARARVVRTLHSVARQMEPDIGQGGVNYGGPSPHPNAGYGQANQSVVYSNLGQVLPHGGFPGQFANHNAYRQPSAPQVQSQFNQTYSPLSTSQPQHGRYAWPSPVAVCLNVQRPVTQGHPVSFPSPTAAATAPPGDARQANLQPVFPPRRPLPVPATTEIKNSVRAMPSSVQRQIGNMDACLHSLEGSNLPMSMRQPMLDGLAKDAVALCKLSDSLAKMEYIAAARLAIVRHSQDFSPRGASARLLGEVVIPPAQHMGRAMTLGQQLIQAYIERAPTLSGFHLWQLTYSLKNNLEKFPEQARLVLIDSMLGLLNGLGTLPLHVRNNYVKVLAEVSMSVRRNPENAALHRSISKQLATYSNSLSADQVRRLPEVDRLQFLATALVGLNARTDITSDDKQPLAIHFAQMVVEKPPNPLFKTQQQEAASAAYAFHLPSEFHARLDKMVDDLEIT